MPESEPGRLERKKQRTSQALRKAAADALQHGTYEEMNVEDVADVAQVTGRTAFRYFRSKLALALCALNIDPDDVEEYVLADHLDVDIETFRRIALVEKPAGFVGGSIEHLADDDPSRLVAAARLVTELLGA